MRKQQAVQRADVAASNYQCAEQVDGACDAFMLYFHDDHLHLRRDR